MSTSTWPITIDDVRDAATRIAPYCVRTPCRRYEPLDAAVGHGIGVWVKHENHQPTNAFKVRNAFSAMTRLAPDALGRGVIGATRGNHGQGLAYAGMMLGCPVVICVPHGNNPEKNAAMRGFGAELIEEGADYDESLRVAATLQRERNLTSIHGTNNANVLAGAGTITLEMLEQAPDLDALVIAVGGGSQAVGALTVTRALKPTVRVYAVQAAGAPAIYESWKAGRMLELASADTFADGVATRAAYEMTFPGLREGLADFITVTDDEIADALRLLLSTTHNLVEGAGAVGLAGVMKLRKALHGKQVGIFLSGGNIDAATLRNVMEGDIGR
jgi:threonine dehydratase